MNQLDKPAKGETIAVMHTSMGDISLRLFPDKTPKACENFITHARNGYYDGLIFHRVIRDFMIQGGDPRGNGTGGESIWGESFEDEPRMWSCTITVAPCPWPTLAPTPTAVSSLLSRRARCPSRCWGRWPTCGIRAFPTRWEERYRQNGGTPWLDFRHTVFGQVFDGMDVVDAIAAVPVGAQDKPRRDVIIQSITIKEYEGGEDGR